MNPITWLSHNRQRWARWLGLFTSFAASAVAVQVMSALAGILTIRALDKTQYAWLTIAVGMMTALNTASDSGLASGVISVGGKIWRDRPALSALIATAYRWRLRLAGLTLVVVVPLSLFLLRRNDCPFSFALLLTFLVALPAAQIAATGFNVIVLRLHVQHGKLQSGDLIHALTRLVAIALLAWGAILNAVTALASTALAAWIHFAYTRRQVRPLLDPPPAASEPPAYDAELRQSLRRLLPNTLFSIVQGQLSIWLISLLADTSTVADFGALSRLSLLFTAFFGPLTQWISPAFARSEAIPRRLAFIALGTMGLALGLSLAVFALAWWFPGPLLAILGGQYANLESELLWVIAYMAFGTLSQTVWHLNVARGWVRTVVWNIPLVIGLQTFLVLLLEVNTIPGVALMGILVASAQTLHASAVVFAGVRAASTAPTS